MPATATELNESRTGNAGSWTLVYKATGSTSDSDVISAVASAAPTTYTVNGKTLVRDPNGPSIEEWVVVNGTQSEARVTVNYQQKEATDNTNIATFDWEQVGETVHITQSRSTVSKTAASGTATDFKGAIGVTTTGGETEIDGTDIQVYSNRFVIKRYLTTATATPSYLATVRSLAGCVNNASWSFKFNGDTYTFAAGEILFEGLSTSERAREADIEMTYHFAYSANATNIPVGAITVAAKAGWDYLWVRYNRQFDSTSKRWASIPAEAYVERVYVWADFSGLGFPT
jgi:hypothetical protein